MRVAGLLIIFGGGLLLYWAYIKATPAPYGKNAGDKAGDPTKPSPGSDHVSFGSVSATIDANPKRVNRETNPCDIKPSELAYQNPSTLAVIAAAAVACHSPTRQAIDNFINLLNSLDDETAKLLGALPIPGGSGGPGLAQYFRGVPEWVRKGEIGGYQAFRGVPEWVRNGEIGGYQA